MATFWERVRDYANRRVREQYMRRYHHERPWYGQAKWLRSFPGIGKRSADDLLTVYSASKN